MAVPADIRTVQRPKNTILNDSGRQGPKRYAVHERYSPTDWETYNTLTLSIIHAKHF